eukprot:1543711-Heterocapsa_arctica.AAC.1
MGSGGGGVWWRCTSPSRWTSTGGGSLRWWAMRSSSVWQAAGSKHTRGAGGQEAIVHGTTSS